VWAAGLLPGNNVMLLLDGNQDSSTPKLLHTNTKG